MQNPTLTPESSSVHDQPSRRTDAASVLNASGHKHRWTAVVHLASACKSIVVIFSKFSCGSFSNDILKIGIGNTTWNCLSLLCTVLLESIGNKIPIVSMVLLHATSILSAAKCKVLKCFFGFDCFLWWQCNHEMNGTERGVMINNIAAVYLVFNFLLSCT